MSTKLVYTVLELCMCTLQSENNQFGHSFIHVHVVTDKHMYQ